MKITKARKRHSCGNCGNEIKPGELYLYEGGRAPVTDPAGNLKGYGYWKNRKHINCPKNEYKEI